MMQTTRDRPAGHRRARDPAGPDARRCPSPGRARRVVRVEATGVSFAEQQMRRGKYYDQPPFPFVPGLRPRRRRERSVGGPRAGSASPR